MSGISAKAATYMALALAGLILSACGRHGPLEAPEGSKSPVAMQSPNTEEETDPSALVLPSADGQAHKKGTKKIDRPKRPFILDSIL